jgi:hypothetical protein
MPVSTPGEPRHVQSSQPRRRPSRAPQGDRRLQRRNPDRVVRLLRLRQPRRRLRGVFLPGRGGGPRPAGQHRRVRHRLRGAPARSGPLRAAGRPAGPQAVLPGHAAADGRLYRADRSAAHLLEHRHSRAAATGRPAAAAGTGGRRRVRRRRHLRGRALAGRPQGHVHQLPADHGDGRLPAVDPRGGELPGAARRGGVRGLGLADPVPAVGGPRRLLGPAAAQAARVAGVREDEEQRHRLEGPGAGTPWPTRAPSR